MPPTSGKSYVEQLQAEIQKLGVGQIATVMGRYYAMDRDKRWDRVQQAYDAMVCGEGPSRPDPVEAVQKSYDARGDRRVCGACGVRQERRQVGDGDGVIFFNFRPDRAREITRALVDADFDGHLSAGRGFLPWTLCVPRSTTPPSRMLRWPTPTRSWSIPSESISASWA
ncbi:MAG: hypothetical protein ACLT9P_10190 [Evtepia gabavorous]